MKRDLLPQRLVLLRQENKITQEELGKLIGVSKAAVSKYEKGLVKPSVSSLWDIADFFNVSVDYLIGKSDAFTANTSDHVYINEIVEIFEEMNDDEKQKLLLFIKKLNDSDLLFELHSVLDPLNHEQRDKMMRLLLFLQKNDFH